MSLVSATEVSILSGRWTDKLLYIYLLYSLFSQASQFEKKILFTKTPEQLILTRFGSIAISWFPDINVELV